MIEQFLSRFGYEKTPPALTLEAQKRIGQEIAAGIGYDMRYFQNWISSYFNPNPIMRSGKFTGYHMFEEMDGDAHIYNVMSMRKRALLARPCYFHPGREGDPQEELKAAFAAWNFERIKHLIQKKREILSHLDYGFSVTEVVLGYADVDLSNQKVVRSKVKTEKYTGKTLKNAVVVKDLKTKIPSAFGFDGTGRLNMVPILPNESAMMKTTGFGSRPLTDEEAKHFLVLTHDPRFGSRYGWPLKASMFWDNLMKKAGQIHRMVFVEKYAMPWLKGTYPRGTRPDGEGGTGQFETKLKGLQKNSYIMTPEGFGIEFAKAVDNPGTMDVYGKLMEFCDGNISEVALGHREAVTSTVGGYGQADVKEAALRQDILEEDGAELDALFNDQLIPLLIDANFAPNGLYPYHVTDVIPESDKNKTIFRYATAYNMRIPFSRAQFYEDMSMRPPESPEDTVLMDEGEGADMSPLPESPDGGKNPTGGDNMQNEKIADGTMKTKSKMAAIRRGGISMTVNL